jgi:hypothetical protein
VDPNGNRYDDALVEYRDRLANKASKNTKEQGSLINSEMTLLNSTGAIVDDAIADLAKGTAKKVLNHVGPVGSLLSAYDIIGDCMNYTGNDRIYAIGLTLTGVVATIILTWLLVPVEATAITTAFAALAIGVPVGLLVDWSKRKFLTPK